MFHHKHYSLRKRFVMGWRDFVRVMQGKRDAHDVPWVR